MLDRKKLPVYIINTLRRKGRQPEGTRPDTGNDGDDDMTIQMTEQQLRSIQWVSVDAECENYEVAAAEYFEDDDHEFESRAAQSEAYGFVSLEGKAPCGSTIQAGVSWMTSGDLRGGYADLFDWGEPEINGTLPWFGVEIQTAVAVCDDEGDEIDDAEVANIMWDVMAMEQEGWKAEAIKTLPKPPAAEEIDTDEDSDMDTIELERDNDADIRFRGEKVASASSFDPMGGPQNVRWTELDLYRTAGGKLVCRQTGCTKWQGERTRHSAIVADDESGLMSQLGYGWLAKDLYAEADIDHAEEIE